MEPYGDLEEDEVAAIYREMFEAGVGAGADLIFLETFIDLAMLRVAAEEAKKKAEEEAKKKAEEEAKKKAAEEKKRKEEEAKKKAAEEKKRKEEEAKKKAEEEAKRKAAEERARAMADGEVTRRLAETVNMRDPDDPDILYGIVPHGSTVTVLEDLGDGWYLVDYDGMEGMISGGYFTEDDP
jgi:uncharacterized membrane protein YqiK